jgi:hypothetical protein
LIINPLAIAAIKPASQSAATSTKPGLEPVAFLLNFSCSFQYYDTVVISHVPAPTFMKVYFALFLATRVLRFQSFGHLEEVCIRTCYAIDKPSGMPEAAAHPA